MRSLGYPAKNILRGTIAILKGIPTLSGIPIFLKMARAAKKWLAGVAMGCRYR